MVTSIFNHVTLTSQIETSDCLEDLGSLLLYPARIAFGRSYEVISGHTAVKNGDYSFKHIKESQVDRIERVIAGIFAVLTALVFIPLGLLALRNSSTFENKQIALRLLETTQNDQIRALNDLFRRAVDTEKLPLKDFKNEALPLLVNLSSQDIIQSFDNFYEFSASSGKALMEVFESIPEKLFDLALLSQHHMLRSFFMLAQTEGQIDTIVSALLQRADGEHRLKTLAQDIFTFMHDTNHGISVPLDTLYRQALKQIASKKNEQFVVDALPDDLLRDQYQFIVDYCKDLPNLQLKADEMVVALKRREKQEV